MNRKAAAIALGLSLVVAGCYGHSFPDAETFIEDQGTTAPTVQVFVDGNGTFYPSGWTAHLERPELSWEADSLLNESDDEPPFRALIESDEVRQLNAIRDFAADKDRIFVLVHGYNNTAEEAIDAYRAIERKVPMGPRDGVVRFYWDGLTGDLLGGAKIWFNAAGYSQLAGSRGLRRVLNQFNGKTVYLIGHSRGTSVILSALSNPVYDPDFLGKTLAVARTWRGDYANLTAPPPLAENGNRFHILVMAPAVDRIDFCDASQQPAQSGPFHCTSLKPLGEQVKSFRYTVNRKDSVLKKFVGAGRRFNPTGLGLLEDVGAGLKREAYPLLQPYVFTTPSSNHGWLGYIEHSTFADMLRDADLTGAGAS